MNYPADGIDNRPKKIDKRRREGLTRNLEVTKRDKKIGATLLEPLDYPLQDFFLWRIGGVGDGGLNIDSSGGFRSSQVAAEELL